jgi:hypothetical protein
MERYTVMYPRGQPSIPDDPVTAYVNNLRTTGAAPGSTMTRRACTARHHDPTRECNVYVDTASSSSESEPAPCHHSADDQWRARLHELVKARRQLDEELDLLHRELSVEPEPRERQPTEGVLVQGQARDGNGDRHPVRDVFVQCEPREENGNQRERRPVADQPRGRAPTLPPARRRPTTIDAPMKVRMPMPTHHFSSGGRPRTWPMRPCCCVATRSPQPPRSSVCWSS